MGSEYSMKCILASASLRRQELLKKITDNFQVIISDFNENEIVFDGSVGNYVMKISMGKAIDVANKLIEGKTADELIIIASDTVVSIDNKVLGKPKDEMDAINMLRLLSGKSHQVYSGISLIKLPSFNKSQDFVCTEVKFSDLSEEDIYRYVKTGEPMDKAGAYGIQGKGGLFVEEIHGCYYNVVGLPINRLNYMLKGMGVNLTEEQS